MLTPQLTLIRLAQDNYLTEKPINRKKHKIINTDLFSPTDFLRSLIRKTTFNHHKILATIKKEQKLQICVLQNYSIQNTILNRKHNTNL